MRHRLAGLLCLLGALVGFACADAHSHTPNTIGAVAISPDRAAPDAIQVQLYEYGVDADPNASDDGRVDFVVTNAGTVEHELVIVPLDGDRYGFPIGDVEHMNAGETRALRTELEPGRYSLVCLVVAVEGEQVVSHRALGMEASFEVRQ